MPRKPAAGPLLALVLAVLLAAALAPGPAHAFCYTTHAMVNLRSGPGPAHPVLQKLDMNQTLDRLGGEGRWARVRTQSGRFGWVRADLVSDTWIKVHKAERRIMLMKGREVQRTWPAAFCPFNPLGDKVKLGDGGTPEGRFFLCELIEHPGQAKYGARSLRLSYPNLEDARRGLADGIIDTAQYLAMVKALKAGHMPPQGTGLGGSIRIHGGGSDKHWTLGCVGMADADVIQLFGQVARGARVEVYKSAAQDRAINEPGRLNRLVLAGAEAQLKPPLADYTREAMAIFRMKYPMGDIPQKWAVCTDIIIRALRQAGLDLQALLHEDAITHPRRYARWIKQADWLIDHRRARNLQVFLTHHALVLDQRLAQKRPTRYQAGDIVTMDTGIPNGTAYDHIAIVAGSKNGSGAPLAINIWTVGFKTMAMDLLAKDYPGVVGHFRLTHPFDYQ